MQNLFILNLNIIDWITERPKLWNLDIRDLTLFARLDIYGMSSKYKKYKTVLINTVHYEISNRLYNVIEREIGSLDIMRFLFYSKIDLNNLVGVGANSYRNIQLLCEPCNRRKSAKIG